MLWKQDLKLSALWQLDIWRFELNPTFKVFDDDYNDVEDDEIVVVNDDVDDKIVVDDDDQLIIENSKLSDPL